MLVNWALERSKRENVPIALESTMDAEPFYEKLGFRSEGCISMPVVVDGESVVYREMCLVYRPSLAV